MKFFRLFLFISVCYCWATPAAAHLLVIYPGDTIILLELDRGIPVHPEVENNQLLFHYASRAEVEVLEVGGYKKRWIRVRDREGKQGWIVKKYVDKVLPGPRGMKAQGEQAAPGSSGPTP